MSRDGDDWDTYGCSRLGGDSPRDIGRSVVVESVIGQGADVFVDRPVEALKVIVLNYDRLVRTGLVPDGGRTISPSLPRYLLAGGAVGGVVAGAAVLWLRRPAGRPAGRRAAGRAGRARRRAGRAGRRHRGPGPADHRPGPAGGPAYRRLAGDYVGLLDEVSGSDSGDSVGRLRERVEELSRRAADLAAGGVRSGCRRGVGEGVRRGVARDAAAGGRRDGGEGPGPDAWTGPAVNRRPRHWCVVSDRRRPPWRPASCR